MELPAIISGKNLGVIAKVFIHPFVVVGGKEEPSIGAILFLVDLHPSLKKNSITVDSFQITGTVPTMKIQS